MIGPGPADPTRDPAFLRYGQRFMSTNASRYSGLLGACVVAWWPIDLLLFDDPRMLGAMAFFRVSTLVLILVVAANPRLRASLERQTAVKASRWLALGMGVTAFAIAHAGGIEEGWAHYPAAGVFAGVAAVVSLPDRMRLTGLVATAGPIAFFLARPGELSHPAVPALVTFYAAAWALTVLTGHAVAQQLAAQFFQGRAVESHREELDRLSAGLESLVAEQTSELRGLAHELQEARDSERLWMASEMHDGLGQQVASLGYALAFIDRAGPSSDAGREVLTECRALLTGMNDTIAAVLERLRPEEVERGLSGALERLVESLAVTSQLRPRLEVDLGPAPIDPDVALASYRVVQEGLSNALKHARASRVVVQVRRDGDDVTLRVQDDGVGFDPEDHSWSGFGLAGIHSRVQGLGGRVHWSRNEDGGPTLQARVPASADASDAGGRP